MAGACPEHAGREPCSSLQLFKPQVVHHSPHTTPVCAYRGIPAWVYNSAIPLFQESIAKDLETTLAKALTKQVRFQIWVQVSAVVRGSMVATARSLWV